ncbi:MAG: cytidine deaminase [Planctomycetes bacterium]|nr:cytidine deaminase [Planctomycetota bacterium]
MSGPSEEQRSALVAAARAVMANAYAPASHFCVGAAVLAEDGRVFVGCNVENASYGLTICAERNALARAVAEGARAFRTIAIATDRERALPPCGACRQVLRELAPDVVVLSVGEDGAVRRWTMAELLPDAFEPGDLAQGG